MMQPISPGVFPAKFYILSSSETIQTNACNFSSVHYCRQPATSLVDDVLECQILRTEKDSFDIETDLDLNDAFCGG